MCGSTYEEYTPVLDHFYLGLSALVIIPLQAVFYAAAVAFDESATLIPGTAFNCMVLTELFFWLGASASLSVRNILVTGLLGVWALHLFIFSIVHTCKARKRGVPTVRKRPIRLPLGVAVSYLLFPWVLFLPFIISCSPNVSYSGYGTYVRFEPYPSDVIGLILIAIAFLVELAAWYGKLRFDLRRTPQAYQLGSPASSFIRSRGIYAFSRHPLLFVAPVLSLGIYILLATPAFLAWGGGGLRNRLESPGREALVACVVAPVAIVVAEVLFVLPWLERVDHTTYSSYMTERASGDAIEGNIWTAYETYRSRTSPIVPLPPALYRRLPRGVQRWVFAERPINSTTANRLQARGAGTGIEC